jgi:hypothetical protein
MRTYSSVVSDITQSQLDNAKQEHRISPGTFSDKVKLIVPNLDDEGIELLRAGLQANEEAHDSA